MPDTPIRSVAMTSEPDDELLERYLTDSCSEDEKTQVEQHMFANDAVFDRLRELEEDLIGRHLRGELPQSARERFDRAYAPQVRRDRVLFSRALSRVAGEAPAPPG